ncbi:leucine-rich repeat domain-containing protein [Bacteroides sp.]
MNRQMIILLILSIVSFTTNPVIANVVDNRYDITLSEAGTLKERLLGLDAERIEGLTLHGPLNGTDVAYISGASGLTANLSFLDLTDITLVNDGVCYATRIVAPEAGMGSRYTYNYYLSDTNYDEQVPTGQPGRYKFNRFRNDLSCAFMGNETLVEIRLPKSIPVVGEYILSECPLLRNVVIPAGVKKIGEWAISTCTVVESITLPASVEDIGPYAFYYTKGLTSMDLASVRIIGNGAFNESGIQSVSLGGNLEYIGEYAFADSRLMSIHIPASIDSIRNKAFYRTPLSDFTLGESVKYIGDEAFCECSHLTSLSIPASLEEIGQNAFYDCPFVNFLPLEDGIRYIGRIAYQSSLPQGLTSVSVKDGTVSLAAGLFQYVPITEITLPSSLKTIGNSCFNQTKLATVNLPEGLRKIGNNAFDNVSTLSSITIPESVEFIGYGAFSYCKGLWKITYNAIDATCTSDWLSHSDGVERILLGDKVKRIPKGLFYQRSSLKDVTFPNSVEFISDYAFYGCTDMQSVKLPDNVRVIEDYAFYECSSLYDIHWPLFLEKIGYSSFRACNKLKIVSLPEGVRELGGEAFYDCGNVRTLYLPSTIETIGDMALYFGCNSAEPAVVTCTATVPPPVSESWVYNSNIGIVKVPQNSIPVYKSAIGWSAFSDRMTAIQEIECSSEESTTSFADAIDGDMDLTDHVIDDVYFTLSDEDEFDPTEGCVMLNSSMTESEMDVIGGMAPGKTDIANRFNGIVIMVDAGEGTLAVECQTTGAKKISVKIGEQAPVSFVKDTKGEVKIGYSVAEPAYIYVYATSENEAIEQDARKFRSRAADASDCVKLYSIGIDPMPSGINDITGDNTNESAIVGYYTVEGIKVDTPVSSGVYIVRRANGTSSKILIK